MKRVYGKAPIIEAVIELRTRHAGDVTLDDLARIHETERDRYPVLDKRIQVESKVEMTDGHISSHLENRQLGFAFKSTDELQTFFATVEGFLFSRSAPYPNWEPFVAEGWRLWQKYRQEAKPEAVTRVGVRFINRIDVPTATVEIKDYLSTYPELAPDLPQVLAGFFMQVRVPLPNYGCSVNVTSAIEQPAPGLVSLLLDIDCFQEVDLDASVPDLDDQVSTTLSQLRDAKNYVFESCITDETRRLIG